MSNTTGYKISNDQDLSQLFFPIQNTNDPATTTGYTSNGKDLNEIFEKYRSGTQVNPTGYTISTGVDISTLFQNINVPLEPLTVFTSDGFVVPTISSDTFGTTYTYILNYLEGKPYSVTANTTANINYILVGGGGGSFATTVNSFVSTSLTGAGSGGALKNIISNPIIGSSYTMLVGRGGDNRNIVNSTGENSSDGLSSIIYASDTTILNRALGGSWNGTSGNGTNAGGNYRDMFKNNTGGGGGAGAYGGNGQYLQGGNGGAGLTFDIGRGTKNRTINLGGGGGGFYYDSFGANAGVGGTGGLNGGGTGGNFYPRSGPDIIYGTNGFPITSDVYGLIGTGGGAGAYNAFGGNGVIILEVTTYENFYTATGTFTTSSGTINNVQYNYILTFTGNGTFTLNTGNVTINYLIVGGGGNGGNGQTAIAAGGGGGGGAVVNSFFNPESEYVLLINVGNSEQESFIADNNNIRIATASNGRRGNNAAGFPGSGGASGNGNAGGGIGTGGGGGGGSSGPGSIPNGGPGTQFIINSTTTTYGVGGQGGGSVSGAANSGNGGAGGNTSSGGAGGGAGGSGIIILYFNE